MKGRLLFLLTMVLCLGLFFACKSDSNDSAQGRIDNWTACRIQSASFGRTAWSGLGPWEGPGPYKDLPDEANRMIVVAQNASGTYSTYISNDYLDRPEKNMRYTMELKTSSYTCGSYYWSLVFEGEKSVRSMGMVDTGLTQ